MDLKEEHILGDQVTSHWYYRAKLAAVTALARDIRAEHLLDVGAGSGYFSRALLERTDIRRATCVDLGYPADRDDSIAGKPIVYRTAIGDVDAQCVLMLDVIEHVADDVAMVADYVARVPRGAHFIVAVPAFMWLWSGHDVFLEHYRRYTLPQAEAVLRRAGLTVERGCYFYGAVLPLVAAVRLARRNADPDAPPASDIRRYPAPINAALLGLCRAEVPVMTLNRLGGTTALVRAVKR